MKKLLILGPRESKLENKLTGGIIVLFENLINELEKNNINHIIIDTNKSNYKNKPIAFISIYFRFLMNISKCSHISIHGTAKDYIFIVPFILLVTKILKKRISLRKFAGNFDSIYKKSNSIKKYLITYILKNSDANFFETKYLVDFFKKYNQNTYWFPNVRNNTELKTSQNFNKKFIFIGSINKEKGIDTIIDVSKYLDDNITIDLFGHLKEYHKNDFNQSNINYKGVLKANNVLSILSEYDVLVLPSLREGYPGVIIEAFSLGLPIIATKLEGIKEMVDEKCSILIEVNKTKEFANAINSINEDNYKNFRLSALNQFKYFNSKDQTKSFLERISF